MLFYEIKLHTMPKIIFAYHVTTEKYKNRFPSYEDLLEISVVEAGTILYDHEDGSHSETPPGTLAPILRDLHCKTYTAPGVLQKHTTVGVVTKYNLRRRRTAEISDVNALRESVRQNGTILIPYQWDLEDRFAEIRELLRRVIFAYTSPQAASIQRALSEWFSLTATLTELVLERLEGRVRTVTPAAEYAREARAFLAEHYAKRPTVSDVAAHLGISAGYLHSIFKQSTGMGVTAYLNRYAIETVKEYLKRTPLSLQEAATLIGIDDPAYMSRLFKKTEGVSFRGYCLRHGRNDE